MAKSVNKVFLLGHVGKDPEIGSTTRGTAAANFSLATSERYKDRSGEWQDRTEWHNLVAYARGAEIVRDYVKKGAKLLSKEGSPLVPGTTRRVAKRCIAPRSWLAISPC